MREQLSFQTQTDVIEWVQSFQRFGIKPGLERVRWLLEQLGNPHLQLKIIHVAGTNGKGSTCKYLTSALSANSYQVGLFTSPYLEAFNNRIAINHEDIDERQLCAVAERICELLPNMPEAAYGHVTEFEIITVLALLYYFQQNVDFVVMETGLGGRLDATNVVEPIISVITNIGYDHIHILGSSLREIAQEKAGIIKSGIPVISGVKQPEAAEVIRSVSHVEKSQLYELGSDFHNKIDSIDLESMTISFNFQGNPLLSRGLWSTQLVAAYQADNLSLALATLYVLQERQQIAIQADRTNEGIGNAVWVGRFEIMQRSPVVIADGAHNPEGFAALIGALERQFGKDKKYIWCVGFLRDKEIEKMIQCMIEYASIIVTTRPASERSADPVQLLEDIAEQIAAVKEDRDSIALYAYAEIDQAVEAAIGMAQEDDIVCLAGSLYMISEARKWWTNKR